MGLMQEIEKLKTMEQAQKEPDNVKDEFLKQPTDIELLSPAVANEDQPVTEDQEDVATETEDTQEDVQEDVEEASNVEKEEKQDNAAMAALRRQLVATQKQLEEQRALMQQPIPKPTQAEVRQQKADDPEPDVDDIEAHLRWENRQMMREVNEMKEWRKNIERQQQEQTTIQRAINNFVSIEQQYKASNPDYDDASAHMVNKMRDGVQAIYPGASQAEVNQFVMNQILNIANSYAAKGLNPAEELYLLSVEKYGFSKEEPAKERTQKASVKTVADNRRKSVTSLNGGGNTRVHKPFDSSVTLADVMRATPEQRAEWIQGRR